MARVTSGPTGLTRLWGVVKNSLKRFADSEFLCLLLIAFQNLFKSFSKSSARSIALKKKRVKAAKAN